MSKLFEDALNTVEKDVKIFVENSMDIVDQIYHILEKKNISQRQLAELLGKKESEISKWLNGTHNFTNRTISKLEAILDEDILVTPLRAKEKYASVKFVKVKTFAKPNNIYKPNKGHYTHANVVTTNYQSKNCKSA